MKKIAGTNWIKGSLAGLVALFLLVVVCGCGNPTELEAPYVVEIEILDAGRNCDSINVEVDFFKFAGGNHWLCSFEDEWYIPSYYTDTIDDAHSCVIYITGSPIPFTGDELVYTFKVNGTWLTATNIYYTYEPYAVVAEFSW